MPRCSLPVHRPPSHLPSGHLGPLCFLLWNPLETVHQKGLVRCCSTGEAVLPPGRIGSEPGVSSALGTRTIWFHYQVGPSDLEFGLIRGFSQKGTVCFKSVETQ